MPKSHVAAICLSVLLCGCATTESQGQERLRAGDLAGAQAMFEQAIRNGDGEAWYGLAQVAERRGDLAQRDRSLQMGARHGDTWSQQALVKMGRPVPPADLKGQTCIAENFGGTMIGQCK